ncbi:MAG: hypothetical protein PHI29_12000 [Gallionella sp.]|nr:hypothetical protein [Gallionella sp.]
MSACCGTKQVTTNLAPPDAAKHVNYVRGMVLEVDEFTQEFAYLSGRDRWLAREAIGYGTLRGLSLSWAQDTTGKTLPQVMLTSGVGLTPCGQLVCVTSNQCADINLWLAARTDEISSGLAADASSGALTLYVTLAYSDCLTDDAPVPGEPCRSADELMQPSRITDSFQLELSYEPPLQEEEDAVRGFTSWLNNIHIDPLPDRSVTVADFVAAVRVWDTASSDPTTLTISATDMPAYRAIALRLWVTELRVAAAAFQRFKLWLYSAPHKTDGTTDEDAFLDEVRRWTPSTCSWPSNVLVQTSDGVEFIKAALALWDTEIVPKWHSEFCGCGAPPCVENCEDRLLLGKLAFKVVKTAGNAWVVDLTGESPRVDESRRPILGHLRLLQEQSIPAIDTGAISGLPASAMSALSGQHIALGRVKFLLPGQPQATPVVRNIRVSSVKSGEVRFTFDGYVQPDINHDYIVHVQTSLHHSAVSGVQPAVRFVEFGTDDFLYKVLRSNKAVPAAEIETMEFQIEVSLIEQP